MNAPQIEEKLVGLQDNMMSFALTLTANRDDAQDLLQETSLKVLNNGEKFVDNVNFKGWVLTVMRNLFINNYRRITRSQAVIDGSVNLYNVQSLSETSFCSPEKQYDIQEIVDAIAALSEDLKEPFSQYLLGYKYYEIAENLGLPLGTVKSRIFFARQELQIKLKDFRYKETDK